MPKSTSGARNQRVMRVPVQFNQKTLVKTTPNAPFGHKETSMRTTLIIQPPPNSVFEARVYVGQICWKG
ncbi:hypothetical protein L596_018419 [Steinernema carpocapsae]|uniref:Uncharacterized protein n=1 Tax=Steinernema carpocapsae TaxID=34508 RepID=A0A4U5N4K0_STECR|nr:hypothetical protein L596_018419 [Steinernema carpocapsae]